MPRPKQPPLTKKIERGLQALSEAAGSTPDPDGSVAAARRWIAARAAWRGAGDRDEETLAQAGKPGHQEVVDELTRSWEREHEIAYPFSVRDARAIRSLRELPDFNLETCRQRWAALLTDAWWRRRGVSIPDLLSQWTRLASKTTSAAGAASPATAAALRLAKRLKDAP